MILESRGVTHLYHEMTKLRRQDAGPRFVSFVPVVDDETTGSTRHFVGISLRIATIFIEILFVG